MPPTVFRLLALALVSASLLFAQEPDYTLKVEVPLMTLDITVENTAENTIKDLPREAFELYENGSRQEIRYFAPVSAPYNVFLLFDRSGSTQGKWPVMQRAIAGFIQSLRPQDQIAI